MRIKPELSTIIIGAALSVFSIPAYAFNVALGGILSFMGLATIIKGFTGINIPASTPLGRTGRQDIKVIHTYDATDKAITFGQSIKGKGIKANK